MGSSLEGESGRWLRQAEDDRVTAERLAELGIHYAACFFAQQAAEKALKAVLLHLGAESVRGHSVVDLCRLLASHAPGFAELVTVLAPLDAFYVPTRYPNGLPGGIASDVFQVEDSTRALRLARRATDAARRAISPPDGPTSPSNDDQ
jgi:HEPN domain-containing protein